MVLNFSSVAAKTCQTRALVFSLFFLERRGCRYKCSAREEKEAQRSQRILKIACNLGIASQRSGRVRLARAFSNHSLAGNSLTIKSS